MRSLRALPKPLLALLTLAASTLARPDDAPTVGINITNPLTCSRPSKKGDKISVNYRGRLLSTGAEFDASYNRGTPFTFVLGAGQVIKGWDAGLLDMCPGEGRELTIPPELGYGNANMGAIPPGSTLIFDTELVDIVGITQDDINLSLTSMATTSIASSASEQMFGIATAPPTPPVGEDDDVSPPLPTAAVGSAGGPAAVEDDGNQAECKLLGPFALLVQGALGVFAILALVYKRWRESPKRPWKIWFFDVSKQVFGSMLTHVLNLAMSMFSTVSIMASARQAGGRVETDTESGRKPNPCSFYLLNLAIDTTLGIPVLYVLLKVLHTLFLRTPIANPPQSIKSGHYGQPPRTTWWLKQAMIYFIGLIGMKLFVLFLFQAMPFLPWIGDWALRWTEGNEALQITFAMFIFPLAMNALQYWIIDNFIMDKQRGAKNQGYEQVHGNEDDDDSRNDGLDGSVTEVDDEAGVKGKAPLKEGNPTPMPYDGDRAEGSSQGTTTPPGSNKAKEVAARRKSK